MPLGQVRVVVLDHLCNHRRTEFRRATGIRTATNMAGRTVSAFHARR
jgi:hypothetical protein